MGFFALGSYFPGPKKYWSVLFAAHVNASDGVIILNSSPKTGRYIDSLGRDFGYGIMRTTLINQTAKPLELIINIPDSTAIFPDSLIILSSPNAYIKLFLPPDTMNFDEISWYNHGGLKPFLDTSVHKAAMLQRTIHPQEEFTFYIGALYYLTRGIPHRTCLKRAWLVF
jgi:hypothetical protein